MHPLLWVIRAYVDLVGIVHLNFILDQTLAQYDTWFECFPFPVLVMNGHVYYGAWCVWLMSHYSRNNSQPTSNWRGSAFCEVRFQATVQRRTLFAQCTPFLKHGRDTATAKQVNGMLSIRTSCTISGLLSDHVCAT